MIVGQQRLQPRLRGDFNPGRQKHGRRSHDFLERARPVATHGDGGDRHGAGQHLRAVGPAGVGADHDHDADRRSHRRRGQGQDQGRQGNGRLSRHAGVGHRLRHDPGRAGDLRRARPHRRHLPPLRQGRLLRHRAGTLFPPGRPQGLHRDSQADRRDRRQGAGRAGHGRPRFHRRLRQGRGQGRHGQARHHRLLLGRPHHLALRRAQSRR